MLINTKTYFKHSGVKGMKWGKSGSDGAGAAGGGDDETEQEEKERMLRNAETLLKNNADMKNGKKPTGEYEDSPTDKAKRDQQIIDDVKIGGDNGNIDNPRELMDALKVNWKRDVMPALKDSVRKVKSITSDSVKKGRAFVDNLFD